MVSGAPSGPPEAAASSGSRGARIAGVAVVLLAAALVSRLAVHRLRGSDRYPLDLAAAWQGASTVLADTGTTAALVWLVLAAVLWAGSRWLRRATDLGPAEAVAGAVVLFWGGSYVALLLLGPFHLYRPGVLRALLLAAVLLAFWAAGRRAPSTRRAPAGWGPWIAALAFGLTAGPLLLMQLGSPVSPFMDVLPYVAATEKIVTFRYYDPLANDAAGIWPPSRQVPGCDGVFSMLALVTGSLGRVTVTSLMVPVAALNLLAMYLLGRHARNGVAGGMACLFLLQTFLWRRSADVRSTALAFPLVAIGLAFLLGNRRSGPRAALGGFTLGLGVATNPLIGAFGMQVAAVGTIVEWLDFRRGFLARVLAQVGGVLIALPTVLIGLTIRTPLWTLALPALAGGALLVLIARHAQPGLRLGRGRATPWARLLCLVGGPLYLLYLHATREVELFPDSWNGYPVLAMLALGGFAALAGAVWRRPERSAAAALPALALVLGAVDFMLVGPWRFQGTLEIKALASEVTPKITIYWYPYWMALAAGAWLGRLAHGFTLVPAVVVALVLVVYPLRHVPEPLDFDGAELSVASTWSFHLTHAARGYWSGRGDRRWVLDANYGAIATHLRGEIAAGTIDYYTHVMVISPGVETVELALATGISADVVSPRFDPNGYWNLGSRARNLGALEEAFAERPRYVVIEHLPPTQFPQLAAYDEVMAMQYVRLYRLRPDAPQ